MIQKDVREAGRKGEIGREKVIVRAHVKAKTTKINTKGGQ